MKQLIILAVIWRLTSYLIMVLAFNLLPFCRLCHELNFLYPRPQAITLASAFKTWDGQHYIYLAEKWYRPNQASNAFYPLFPFLIKVVRPLFLGNSLLAGLLLVNIFSVGLVVVFYRLCTELFDQRVAFRAGVLLLAFPTSFYLGLVYTEALFLFLLVGWLYSWYGSNWRLLGIISFLLPLTRAQGVLILIPMLVIWVTGRLSNRWWLILAPVTGYIFYLVIMGRATGFWLSGFEVQSQYIFGYSISNWFRPFLWFKENFITIKLSLHGFNNSLLDRLFFLSAISVLVFSWNRLDRIMTVLVIAMAFFPALSGRLSSYPRFALSLLPLFIMLAVISKNKFWNILIPMGMLQVLFLIFHSLNYWVA